MHKHNSIGASSLSSILAVAAAAAAALVILFVFILPAEFGKDPTGLGEQMGVNNMSVEGAEGSSVSTSEAGAVSNAAAGLNPDNIVDNSNDEDRIEGVDHVTFATPMQFAEIEIPVAANGQLEYKFVLDKGSQIHYQWSVNDGKLAYSDLHGHTPAPEGSEEDEIVVKYLDSQEDQNVSGQFTAPFSGDHGWFFLNVQDEDIVITLRASGHWKEHELLPIESYY